MLIIVVFPTCGHLLPLFCLFFLLLPQRLIVLFLTSEQAKQVDCLFPWLTDTGWLFCFFCLWPCAQVNNKQIRLIVLSLGGVLDARKTHTVLVVKMMLGGAEVVGQVSAVCWEAEVG